MYFGFPAGAAGIGAGSGTALTPPPALASVKLSAPLTGNNVTCDAELSLKLAPAFVRPPATPSSCARTPQAIPNTNITSIHAFVILSLCLSSQRNSTSPACVS
jgi:hypothetical protein